MFPNGPKYPFWAIIYPFKTEDVISCYISIKTWTIYPLCVDLLPSNLNRYSVLAMKEIFMIGN